MSQAGLFKTIHYFGSQRELAKAIGVPQSTVSRWVNGERKIPDIYAIWLFIKTVGHVQLQELVSSYKRICYLLERGCFLLKNPATSMPIGAIQVKDWICPKYKDDDSALMHANDSFLSVPVLVDSNNQLIVCACRLRVYQLRGNRTIPVYSVNFNNVINGTFSLIPWMQKLPVSEKGTVALAIEHELGNRQGERRDLLIPTTSLGVIQGIKTREITAKLVGFKNEYVYRQIKIVLKQGIPALICAMDEEKCSISQAKKIALLPQQEQQAALTDFLTQKKPRAFILGEMVCD